MKTSSSMSQMKLQHEYTNFAEIHCTLYMFRNTWTTGQFYSQVCFRGLVWEYLKNSSCSVKLSWFYSSVCLYSVLCRFWPLSCKLHSSVLPFIFTLDFPKLSLIRWSSYVTMDGWWSGRMWKMNLSHQEQGLLPLRRGSHPLPLDRFDESPLVMFSRRKSWDFTQTRHCFVRLEMHCGKFH